MAKARITICVQELPPDKQAHGGTEELRRLAYHLGQSYLHDNFKNNVLVASEVEDRVTEVEVVIMMLDVLNYQPNGPRLRIKLEMPTSAAGKVGNLTSYHRRFFFGWLQHHVPAENVLQDEEKVAVIPVALRFAQVHDSFVVLTA